MKYIFSLPFVALLSWTLASEALAHPANSETSPAKSCLSSFIKQLRSYWQVPAEQMVITDVGVAPLINGFTSNANLYPQAHGNYRGTNFDTESLVLTDPAPPTPSNKAQKKYIHPNGDKSKCLGASSNSDGARVELFDCPKGSGDPPANILWTPDNGLLRVFENRCLDDTGGVTTDGQKMQIWTCGHKNQIWNAREDGSIELGETKKCLDNTDGKMVTGNPAQIWSCTGISNQKWTISTAGPNYEIRLAPGDGLCLAAENHEGAKVTVEYCDRSIGQAWNPEEGVLRIYEHKCLTISPGFPDRLQITTCVDGDKDQRWISPILHRGYGEGPIRWPGRNLEPCVGVSSPQAGVRAFPMSCSGEETRNWRYLLAC